MTHELQNMKQVQVKDLQENFEQIFEDVLMSSGPRKIVSEMGKSNWLMRSTFMRSVALLKLSV